MKSGTATTAGNYPDYSAYCTPTDTKKFLTTFWCTSRFEDVGRAGILNGLTELGHTARYHTMGNPTVHDFVKNGALSFDTLSSCPVDYKLDTIRYSAMKFDLTDTGACRFPEMRREWQDRVPRMHSEQFDSRLLCQLPAFAASCTQGSAAGAAGSVNLGTLSAPVPVSGAIGANLPAGVSNIFEYMTRGVQVIGSFRIPVERGITAFVPDEIRWLMINSDYAVDASINGAGSSWMGTALNGFCGDRISMRCSAEVRASTCIHPVGSIDVSGSPRPVYRILWLWNDGFSAVNRSYMMRNGLPAGTPLGQVDVRMTISGAAVSHREGVAVGYVYIA
jgi:hypothetical protein